MIGVVLGAVLGAVAADNFRDWRAKRARRHQREQLVAEVAPMVVASIQARGVEWTTAAGHWDEIKKYAHGTPGESLEAICTVLQGLRESGQLEARTGRPFLGSIAPIEFRPTATFRGRAD